MDILFNKLFQFITNKTMMHECIPIMKTYSDTDWTKFKSKSDSYSREVVCRTPLFELILISWSPHSKSKRHDHADNGCILNLLEGELTEVLFVGNEQKEKKVSQGELSYIDNDVGTHLIKNDSDKYAYSLHLYSPSFQKCNVFD